MEFLNKVLARDQTINIHVHAVRRYCLLSRGSSSQNVLGEISTVYSPELVSPALTVRARSASRAFSTAACINDCRLWQRCSLVPLMLFISTRFYIKIYASCHNMNIIMIRFHSNSVPGVFHIRLYALTLTAACLTPLPGHTDRHPSNNLRAIQSLPHGTISPSAACYPLHYGFHVHLFVARPASTNSAAYAV